MTYTFSEAYDQPSYDEVTSNLSEAANQWLGNSCRSPYPLKAFEQYFVKVIEFFAERRRKSPRRKVTVSREILQLDSADESHVCSSDTTPNQETHSNALLPVYKNKTGLHGGTNEDVAYLALPRRSVHSAVYG